MSSKPLILWFRRDLRLADNPAVRAAAEDGRPVIPVYVLDKREGYCWDNGGASRWWLHHSLASLNDSFGELGGQLILRSGDSVRALEALVDESGADRLLFSRIPGEESARLEKQMDEQLASRIEVRAFLSYALHEPGSVCTTGGEPYKVFTPFWRACRKLPDPAEPIDSPDCMTFSGVRVRSDDLDDWRLTPDAPDWAGGLRETWTPGERGALTRIREFLDVIRHYGDDQDRPDLDGTSRLSPHLHFGEISPRQLWHDIHRFCDPQQKGAAAFLRQLYWREFSQHLLQAFPQLPREPLREEFRRFPWRRNQRRLGAWQRGMTGYPIVDAGMRELWHTGWMHNRVRLVAASLLVKHLLVPWQEGADWFRDTLVDADEANNSANWQWVAGCGTDAAPYFRIFNPVIQGRKFDPDGRYTRRWLPELEKLDSKWLHAPWEAPNEELRRSGIVLDRDYPRPIVDHQEGREQALAAFRRIRSS